MEIRRASLQDLRALQDLNFNLFLSDNVHFGDLNVNWPYEKDGEAYFRSLADGTYGVCFVAEAEGEVVGYLAGVKQRQHSAYKGVRAELENMCVSDSHRSQGVGAKLVEALKTWCRDEGDVDYLDVTAFSPNTRAIEFYQKQGFVHYSDNLWLSIK
jgi:GNAT superfamily N-acetyltransferase